MILCRVWRDRSSALVRPGRACAVVIGATLSLLASACGHRCGVGLRGWRDRSNALALAQSWVCAAAIGAMLSSLVLFFLLLFFFIGRALLRRRRDGIGVIGAMLSLRSGRGMRRGDRSYALATGVGVFCCCCFLCCLVVWRCRLVRLSRVSCSGGHDGFDVLRGRQSSVLCRAVR